MSIRKHWWQLWRPRVELDDRVYQFVVIQPFRAVVRGYENEYHAGAVYTVRHGAEWDDLHRQVQDWASAGKIKIVIDDPHTAVRT